MPFRDVGAVPKELQLKAAMPPVSKDLCHRHQSRYTGTYCAVSDVQGIRITRVMTRQRLRAGLPTIQCTYRQYTEAWNNVKSLLRGNRSWYLRCPVFSPAQVNFSSAGP
jgi:hypothetical protein